MIEGSCLCGQIKYQVDAGPAPMGHCHCRACRKAHASAFSTVMGVPKAAFSWVQGEGLLASFESSPGKQRYFCSVCGSHLVAMVAGRDVALLRVGSIDTELSEKPKVHIWRSEGASWYDPKNQLPELPEGL